jgi:hypothetical protein
MLTSYKIQANGGCSLTSSTSANCYASDGDIYSDSYEFYPTSGLNLYFNVTSVYLGPPSAWASASWSTTGQYNWYSWNPGASHSPYYYDPYAVDGGISLLAHTGVVGDYASVSAGW